VTGQGGLVVIDYDVGQAFIPVQELDPSSTDSGFIFSPVLRAVDANRSGWITGTVLGGSNAGSPVVDASLRLYLGDPADAENTWSMLGTAKTATDGRFRFASVTRSAYWEQLPAHAGETYIVTIDPPPGSGLTRRIFSGLSVSAASKTALGQIVLP